MSNEDLIPKGSHIEKQRIQVPGGFYEVAGEVIVTDSTTFEANVIVAPTFEEANPNLTALFDQWNQEDSAISEAVETSESSPSQKLLKKVTNAYDTFMEVAAPVEGMPFETPIRKADIRGFDPGSQRPGVVVEWYVMVGYEDGKNLTIRKDFTADGVYKPRWKVVTKIPRDGNTFRETAAKLYDDGRHKTDIHDLNEQGGSIGYNKGTDIDLEDVMTVIDEGIETAPARQAEFINKLTSSVN